MSKKKVVLGQGLSAILRDINQAPHVKNQSDTSSQSIDNTSVYKTLNVSALQPGTFQPRQSFHQEEIRTLSESIEKNGVLQPLIVREVSTDSYEIIAGERRWRAAKLANLENVPVVVHQVDDRDAMVVALVENLQREDLNPLEEAEGLQRVMQELHVSQEDLGRLIGKSRSYVANTLRLIKVDDSVKELLRGGRITSSVARTIVKHPEAGKVARMFIDKQMNVRQLEEYMAAQKDIAKKVSSGLATKQSAEAELSRQDEERIATEKSIEQALGVKASLSLGKKRKVLKLEFSTMDQLDSILEKLTS